MRETTGRFHDEEIVEAAADEARCPMCGALRTEDGADHHHPSGKAEEVLAALVDAWSRPWDGKAIVGFVLIRARNPSETAERCAAGVQRDKSWVNHTGRRLARQGSVLARAFNRAA
jgi:hypothetical protein